MISPTFMTFLLNRQQTPSDDLDAYHHNRIKVELVIGFNECRVTNHKQDLNPIVIMRI